MLHSPPRGCAFCGATNVITLKGTLGAVAANFHKSKLRPEILFVWFHLPTAGLWLCCDLSRPAPALFAGGFDPLQIWEGTICKV